VNNSVQQVAQRFVFMTCRPL